MTNADNNRYDTNDPAYATKHGGIRYEGECKHCDRRVVSIIPEPQNRHRAKRLWSFCMESYGGCGGITTIHRNKGRNRILNESEGMDH